MITTREKNKAVSAYIKRYPANVRKILEKMRKTIRKAAPAAEEGISWGMPVYKLNRILTFFAAFKEHVSLFPAATGIKAFKKELAGYKTSKGTVRFALDKPIPYGLITKIVKYRVRENLAAMKKKP
jgi:uncharacterized protein YdhG (YjbR/CyaY superfamily)